MKHQKRLAQALLLALGLAGTGIATLSARTLYIAPTGNDAADGTLERPWATLRRAQEAVQPGDTVYIRGGKYAPTNDDIMAYDKAYAQIYQLHKSGRGPTERICYIAYPGDERPVFDCSQVRPEGYRVSAFHVEADWLYLYGFDIVGVQVVVKGHTQSECISMAGGSNCVFEFLAMHDGMAIGYYQLGGSNNLVLNCDAYCNYDPYSEGPYGGNVDGFGGHVKDGDTAGNVFRGCRAWWNSDDGFDLINSQSAFTIERCWSFYNGYQPGGFERAGDGTGFKAGGYGMKPKVREPKVVPHHVVRNCIAYRNKNKGFYANHHLGGNDWNNNTAYKNPSNFSMLNRASAGEVRDTTGYGHVLSGNLSLGAASPGRDLESANSERTVMWNNAFGLNVSEDDFVSLDPEDLMKPRNPDGSLPEIDFLKVKRDSELFRLGLGYQF